MKTATRKSGGGGWVPWAFALVLAPLAPAILTGWLHPRAPAWRVLAAKEVAVARVPVAVAWRDYPDALWLDARPAAERAAGGVPGALGLSEEDWEAGFATLAEKWDGRRPIVVYCGGDSCQASEAVALRLRGELGFDRIMVLAGGWEAWRAAEGEP